MRVGVCERLVGEKREQGERSRSVGAGDGDRGLGVEGTHFSAGKCWEHETQPEARTLLLESWGPAQT
jgi:hypothetical protein